MLPRLYSAQDNVKISKRKPQLRLELKGPIEGALTPYHLWSNTPKRKILVTDLNRKTSGTNPIRKCNHSTTPAGGWQTSIAQQQAQPMKRASA